MNNLMSREQIFLFGAGGHAKVVIDLIEQERRFSISFLLDDNPLLKGADCAGYEIRGGIESIEEPAFRPRSGLVAIGNNGNRRRVAAVLLNKGFDLVTAVHPSTVVARGVVLGRGTIAMAGVILNTDALIGANVILNTGAQVDHDCSVGDGTHLAPRSVLCGGVQVGEDCLIGAGAVVLPGRRIGRRACVGAGAIVVHDVAEDSTVWGNPARPRERS